MCLSFALVALHSWVSACDCVCVTVFSAVVIRDRGDLALPGDLSAASTVPEVSNSE